MSTCVPKDDSMSKSLLQSLVLLAALAVGTTAAAGGFAAQGQGMAAVCGACHGADGNSINPEWPSLAGQHEAYIAAQLKAFRDGQRENILMSSQAIGLTEQEMMDLGAFYASQAMKPKTADPAVAGSGERLYRGGNKERAITACIACHGPTGRGNPLANFPAIGGQHATYTAAQLELYASGERDTDGNQSMRSIARLLTENEIEAVASYIQGLRDE